MCNSDQAKNIREIFEEGANLLRQTRLAEQNQIVEDPTWILRQPLVEEAVELRQPLDIEEEILDEGQIDQEEIPPLYDAEENANIDNDICDDCGRVNKKLIKVRGCCDRYQLGENCCVKRVCSNHCIFYCENCNEQLFVNRGFEVDYEFLGPDSEAACTEYLEEAYLNKGVLCPGCGHETPVSGKWDGISPEEYNSRV